MHLQVPNSILEDHFFRFVHGASSSSNGANGSCPICNEGKSFGKKKRFHYYKDINWFSCYNCNASIGGVKFMMDVCGYSFKEVKDMVVESGDCEYLDSFRENVVEEVEFDVKLPPQSYNLVKDELPKDYFVKLASNEIKKRRLDTAVNRTDLYTCKTPVYDCDNSYIHQNRLIIPHYDTNRKLTFYQSRSITSKQAEFGKYISCRYGNKTLWGLHGVNHDYKHLFVTEGAFDAFFVRNCIATGGLKMNETQKKEFTQLEPWFGIIWCYDNDFHNPDVVDFYRKSLMSGKKVFMWGGEFSKYKDFNEYCIDRECDEITHEELLKHVYSGKEGIKMLDSKIRVDV